MRYYNNDYMRTYNSYKQRVKLLLLNILTPIMQNNIPLNSNSFTESNKDRNIHFIEKYFKKVYSTKRCYDDLILIYETAPFTKIKKDKKNKLIKYSVAYSKVNLLAYKYLSYCLYSFLLDLILINLLTCASYIIQISKYVYYKIRQIYEYPITFVFNKLFSSITNYLQYTESITPTFFYTPNK